MRQASTVPDNACWERIYGIPSEDDLTYVLVEASQDGEGAFIVVRP